MPKTFIMRAGLCTQGLYVQHYGDGLARRLLPIGTPVRVETSPDAIRLYKDSTSKTHIKANDPHRNAGTTHTVSFTRGRDRGIRNIDRPYFIVDELSAHLDNNSILIKLPPAHLLAWGHCPPVNAEERARLALDGIRRRVRSATEHGLVGQAKRRVIDDVAKWAQKSVTSTAFYDAVRQGCEEGKMTEAA